ncbi:hypothetical protein Hanom_Chr07g00648041 [Helianthus anomalus]
MLIMLRMTFKRQFKNRTLSFEASALVYLVEAFCIQWGIDLWFNPESLGLDKSIDQCPACSVALYCRHFEFSNLRYPFSTFILSAAGYDPSLLAFRRFFRLAKNDDWFMFETSQVDMCLISSMSIVPFKMIWRHPDAVLNDLEPSNSDLDNYFLKSIRVCPFPEPLLVLMGISKLWDKPDQDLVLMRDGQGMHFDDTSYVVFVDVASAEGEDVVVRGSKHRFERSDYVSVPNAKGFVKIPSSKQSTRCSTRRKGAGQRSSSETINLVDDLEVEDTEVPADGKKGELPLVVGNDTKALGKKVGGLKPTGNAIEGSSNVDSGEIYVPDWKVTVSDSFKSVAVCEDVLNHFAPHLSAMKANMATLKKETERFAEKEKAWQKKVHELTQRHEVKVCELKQQVEASIKENGELEASLGQLAKDNKWLIEHGFQQVVTYLLHSSEFNSALGDVYSKLLLHRRHQGYTAGYDAGAAGTPKDKSSLFQPGAFEVFKDTVVKMERLTYPYMSEVSECYGKPLSVLQG